MRAHKNFLKKRVAAALTVTAVLIGTAPAVAEPVATPADTADDPTWTVEDASGKTDEAEPAVPSVEIPNFPAEEEDKDATVDVPAAPTLTKENKVVSSPELAEDPTFEHVRTLPDGTEEYKLEARLNLPSIAGSDQALPLEDISLMSVNGPLNIEDVEDAKVDGSKLDEDSVDVFNYPKNPSEEEKNLIPDEITGDVITLDTTSNVLSAEADVTATVYTSEKAPGNAKWVLYSGVLPEVDEGVSLFANPGQTIDPRSPLRPDHSRLVVQVAGDRLLGGRNGATQAPGRESQRQGSVFDFSPGAGAELQLYRPLRPGEFNNLHANLENLVIGTNNAPKDGPMVPINEPWAKCVADQNGECVFDIPRFGAEAHEYYWVGMTKASPGYSKQDIIRVGASGDIRSTQAWRLRYAYATPYLEKGKTYYSGAQYTRRDYGPNGADRIDGAYGAASFMYERRSWDIDGNGQPLFPTNPNPWRSSLGAFQQVRDNPKLPDRCGGLRVGFVIDTSGSMGQGMPKMRDVMTKIVNSLQVTETEIGLVSFASDTPGFSGNIFKRTPENILEPQKLNNYADRQRVNNWISNLTTDRQGGATNWEQGLLQFANYNAKNPAKRYDVVYMITDGNPTVWRPNPSSSINSGVMTEARDVEAAMAVANTLKSQNTRIVPVGIPSDWPGSPSGTKEWQLEISDVNLQAISGPSGPGNNTLREADFAYFDDSDLMQKAITNMLTTCDISVERRFYDGDDPNAVPSVDNTWGTIPETTDAKWGFTAEMTPNRGAVERVYEVPNEESQNKNEGPDVPPNRRINNKATFTLNGETDYKTVDITEAPSGIPDEWIRMDARDGQRAECKDMHGKPVAVEDITGSEGKTNDFRLTGVPRTGGYHCIVYYRKPSSFDFTLNKVDAQDNQMVLDGAQFKLEGLDAGNKGPKDKNLVPNQAKGQFSWEKLSLGRYKLTETKAADGGYLLVNPVYFRVASVTEGDGNKAKRVIKLYLLANEDDQVGKEVTANDTEQILKFPVVGFTQTVKDNKVQVGMKLANTKTGELPKTGGNGVFIQILLGVLLLLAGAFTARRRIMA